MSGHSGFAPIGNNIPAVNPSQIGGVEPNVQQPARDLYGKANRPDWFKGE